MSDNKLSPVMQQYVDMKAENPDALLLFRLGDFYEVFFEDAKTVSAAIGIVLTHRGVDANGDDIPMCGIPWHAADNYFGRLVRDGYKVALVEQMETPAQAKAAGRKFVTRQVVRVLTPGTLTDENLLTPKNSNFLVAVAPRNKEQEQGTGVLSPVPCSFSSFLIAGCDISTGEFFIGESAAILDDLVRVNPAEIIYPETDAENPEIMRLRDTFKTTPVYEKLYNRADIDQIVFKIFGQNFASSRQVEERRVQSAVEKSQGDFSSNHESRVTSHAAAGLCGSATCNGAVALLAGYLFNTQRDANIAFRAPYAFKAGTQLLVDSATWKSLEIDSPINDGGTCLVDILDKTKTAAGARRLRSYLRALSGDIGEIRRRQEHIGHLILNRDVMGGLERILSRVPDVGRSLARLLSGRGAPRDLRVAADFMVMLGDAKSMGARLDSDLAAKFANIDTHDALAGELKFALNDELPTFFRDGGIIRAGFDPSLDNMKELANGAKETIAGLQAQYAAATGVGALRIKYNNILGYFIEVPSPRADALMNPENGFIHRQTMAGNMRFTTPRLIDLDNDVRSAAEKAGAIESEIIANLIEKIRAAADDLLNTAELIADADVWRALADVADEYSWVRPAVTESRAFDVRGGRHPVIEAVLRSRGDAFVKNDCVLDGRQIALLTGPNMAGKSTYLRQNALIVVLAHLGAFVPAERATIGVCDQLFSRVGASDNLAAGQSTFMVEMTETANILNRATRQSFIIFDEIGRGTATYDGMAIAQAVLEFLDDVKPRTLFATHYHELTALVPSSEFKVQGSKFKYSGDEPGITISQDGSACAHLNSVNCLTIEIREHNGEIVFMHKIIPGVASRSYGIHVAKMAGIPISVINRAEDVLNALETRTDAPARKTPPAVKKVEDVDMIVDEPGVKPQKVAAPANKTQLSLFG
ncbi:MAG: DNA mismatch repair protein MutS [Rickettsiales bacterium]|jgi:DNA mismatch repair protein MutS|nr:DNA mismatch repair protein MutS [Rickettsiales bacterium]